HNPGSFHSVMTLVPYHFFTAPNFSTYAFFFSSKNGHIQFLKHNFCLKHKVCLGRQKNLQKIKRTVVLVVMEMMKSKFAGLQCKKRLTTTSIYDILDYSSRNPTIRVTLPCNLRHSLTHSKLV
ncbi:hypothetical protein ACTXT7_013279, partial [Hymenolepis weldensis]